MKSHYKEFMKSQPYLPFHVGYLSKAMVAKAEKELGETEEVKAKTIPELRKLIEEEPNFSTDNDDLYLLSFLRPRKFDLKKAFSLVQNSFKVKKMYGDIYDTCDPVSLKKTFGLKTIMCLPYRDKEGCVIMLIRMQNWDPDVSSAGEFVTALTVSIFLGTHDPVTQVCGFRILVDLRGLNMKQARSLTPRFLYLIARALRNSIAARFIGIHVYNESAIFPCIWSIIKIFLSEKIKSRVHFHGNNQEQLHKFIPKAILPVEYGGDNPLDVGSWYNSEVEKFFGRYAEMVKLGYRK